MSHNLEYLDPRGELDDAKLAVPTLPDLRGRRLAFVNNGWRSFTRIGAALEAELKSAHGLAGMHSYAVPTAGPPEDALLERIAVECDAAVVGLAN